MVVTISKSVVVLYVRIMVVNPPAVVVESMVVVAVVHRIVTRQPTAMYPTITASPIFPVAGYPIGIYIRS